MSRQAITWNEGIGGGYTDTWSLSPCWLCSGPSGCLTGSSDRACAGSFNARPTGNRRTQHPPHLRIQPFKTIRRQTLIDQLLIDPIVVKAVETHVAEAGLPRDVAMAKAERYAREIVPAFNAYAYLRLGTPRMAR